LPTEAEWEYACRSGSKTRFYFGDDEDKLGDFAWYLGNSDGKTHPVGQKKPNSWGLYDMHGNVWQWCSDWYESYGNAKNIDPQGPASGKARVYRGGSVILTPIRCRSAYRSGGPPETQNNTTYGFRVVVEIAAPPVADDKPLRGGAVTPPAATKPESTLTQ
jgi:formylglycine-generating enzyme required for sulfatase activity